MSISTAMRCIAGCLPGPVEAAPYKHTSEKLKPCASQISKCVPSSALFPSRYSGYKMFSAKKNGHSNLRILTISCLRVSPLKIGCPVSVPQVSRKIHLICQESFLCFTDIQGI